MFRITELNLKINVLDLIILGICIIDEIYGKTLANKELTIERR